MTEKKKLLEQANSGDIRAFHTMFSEFQPQLKSYVYRLVANRNDMEDLVQDIFILAYENIDSFRGESAFKTWVFTIATNHAKKHLKLKNRWHTNTFEQTKDLAHSEKEVMNTLDQTHQHSVFGTFIIREHIDYCFTCVSKMLPIDQQVALILKDIYDFKVNEAAKIMNITYGAIKHLLHNSRKKMIIIFNNTCALVSKKGICHQCSGLNGKFNPKEDSQGQLMKIKMMTEKNREDKTNLYMLRTELVKSIDPLHGEGAELHEAFMSINHRVNA